MESLSEGTTAGYQQIHDGIIHLVDSARTETVRSVNALMTATYWEIGRQIVEFEQGGETRAAYGAQLIKRLSKDLSLRYKRGFSTRNLWQFKNFYICFQRIEIVQTLSAQFTPTIRQTLSGESCHLAQLAKSFPLPCPLTSVCFLLKTLTLVAFMRKKHSAVAGLLVSSNGKLRPNFMSGHYCHMTNQPCCNNTLLPRRIFFRNGRYAIPLCSNFWN